MQTKMKLSINRNTIWCDLFVKKLSDLGVKYACISPGSRSTPLTLAFAENKSIQTFPIVDERSSSFFALGLAKQSNLPVAVITTSGTAVAELYPAIIEAYYQRVPLIICTADRPQYLRNSGSNQTINQNNIYKNHIRYFADAGLPSVQLQKLNNIMKIAEQAFSKSLLIDKGPVHINFPFEKPFEPDTYTDKIDIKIINKLFELSSIKIKQKIKSSTLSKSLINKFVGVKRGLILMGYDNYDSDLAKSISEFSDMTGFPIVADGASGMRFCKHSKKNYLSNFATLVRSEHFLKYYDPEIILQFGGSPTSNIVLEFLKNTNAEKILINEYGDKNDPSLTAKTIIKSNPVEFCNSMLHALNKQKILKDKNWLKELAFIDHEVEVIKRNEMKNASITHESKVVFDLLEMLPGNVNVMVSNSLPIRDLDFFTSNFQKPIRIFCNRGASGIDGITSTTIGIAKASKKNTVLLTGDLAFYHDMNGLLNAIKFNIPLTIVLINNNGGGIFESLPISRFGNKFIENFITPLNLNFAKFVRAYGGNYKSVNNSKSFKAELNRAVTSKSLAVIEIKSNSKKSKILREKIWKKSVEKINLIINETLSRRN